MEGQAHPAVSQPFAGVQSTVISAYKEESVIMLLTRKRWSRGKRPLVTLAVAGPMLIGLAVAAPSTLAASYPLPVISASGLNLSMPDPGVYLYNGTFYEFSTGTGLQESHSSIAAGPWTTPANELDTSSIPSWIDYSKGFWAPDMIRTTSGEFVVYFSAALAGIPSGNPAYPYSFKGSLRAVGGSGRLAHATGTTEWRGAYTGVPGQFFFTFDGSSLAGAPAVLVPENFQALGQVGFTNLKNGILPNGIVPYTGVAQSAQIGPDIQTGTIRNLTGLIPIDSTTFLFLGEVGPHPLLPKKADVHLVHTGQGDIYCTWTAIFTMKILDSSGDAVLSGDGDFHVIGGSGRYQGASGHFRTVFVTYPVPAGADAAVAAVAQSGNIQR